MEEYLQHEGDLERLRSSAPPAKTELSCCPIVDQARHPKSANSQHKKVPERAGNGNAHLDEPELVGLLQPHRRGSGVHATPGHAGACFHKS